MSKVFVDVGTSLDGYIAGPNGGPNNPLGDGGRKIHDWMFAQKSFREKLGMEGGEVDNRDSEIIAETFHRIGANIMGKRMFEEGEANWPEKAPFGVPVYVLTHQKQDPWKRPGGTIFLFSDDDIHDVLEKAQRDAGEKDVRISGGADAIRQYLNAGLVDEISIHIAPILLGSGIRLFESIDRDRVSFEILEVIGSPRVTHLKYKIIK